MERPPDEKLAWPPEAEDLRRLYLEEHLSAAKIADRYGLKYASAKTAESTILYHLKRNGITRRDKAEHIRRVTEEMVDEWVRRYEAGESLKQIAANEFSPVTVFLHLKKRGIQLRDKVQAQIQTVTLHKRTPFSGDARLRAYLIGMTLGDYWVTNHGRATRVKLSTTHPGMASLFRQLFESHGPIYEYPRVTSLTEFEWSLDCDLDESFGFLKNPSGLIEEIFASKGLFVNFLAGFFDAEGSIWYHKGGSFEVSIACINKKLIQRIANSLYSLGFSTKVSSARQRKNERVSGELAELIWKCSIWRRSDVQKFLQMVPLCHPEKSEKARIALKALAATSIDERKAWLVEWQQCKDRIAAGVANYVQKAKSVLAERASMIQ